MHRRGTVFIAPTELDVPGGAMIDPASGSFWASWQDTDVLDNARFVGADAAVAWGRERATRVLIRLGQTRDTYFTAGEEPSGEMPPWPPDEPPDSGWWGTGLPPAR